MNIDDLKKMKVIDLKNVIRNYKKTNCPAYSTLKKSQLIDSKKIANKKKQFEKAPAQTAIERRDRTGKREKINQKIDELLDIQKYLNTIYRDNITEKIDKEKIKILLK